MQEETTPAAVSPKPHLTRQLTSLFQHDPSPHKPRNVNVQHKAEQEASGVNTRIAVGLTNTVGTMWTAYSFAVLAIVGERSIHAREARASFVSTVDAYSGRSADVIV